MKGTIVENGLADKNILADLNVTKTWSDEDWILHDVVIDEFQIESIRKALGGGPWYVHFWEGDTIIVVYKDKIFHIKKSDVSSWSEAIEYGKSLGIPDEQLDFLTE